MHLPRRFLPLTRPEGRCGLAAVMIRALLLLPALQAFGTEPIHLSLDRQDGCYARGESAIISVTVAPDVLAQDEWKANASWQRDWSSEPASLDWSPAESEIVLSLDGQPPGQIVITVALHGTGELATTHERKIGLLYRPEEIELSTPEPEDFEAFWKNQVRRWRELPEEVLLREVEAPQDGILCWDVTLKLKGEKPVSGYLAMPAGAAPGDLPALISLHGAGVRSSSLPVAAKYAASGFMAIDMNAHGLPNGREERFYQEQNEGDLRGYRSDGAESRETWYFRTMYLRIITAIDYLCARPEWNGRDLVLRGSSQGGGQALAGAGLDPRVTVVAASVPALCDLAGIPSHRKGGWPGLMNQPTFRQPAILATMGYFDGGIFARRIQAPVILSLGLADHVCPAMGIQATRNNLAGPSAAIYRPAMGHAFPQDIQEAFDDFILEHVTLATPQ